LQPIDIESLRPLLLDPAVQRVLLTQGLALPGAAQAIVLDSVRKRIDAQGLLIDTQGQGLHATRETLQHWARLAFDGGGYAAPALLPGSGSPPPSALVAALTAAERDALTRSSAWLADAVTRLRPGLQGVLGTD